MDSGTDTGEHYWITGWPSILQSVNSVHGRKSMFSK